MGVNSMWEEYEGKQRKHWIDADYIFIVLVLVSIIIHIIGEIYSGISSNHIDTTESYATNISSESLTDTSAYTINGNNEYIIVKEIEDDIFVIVQKEDKNE